MISSGASLAQRAREGASGWPKLYVVAARLRLRGPLKTLVQSQFKWRGDVNRRTILTVAIWSVVVVAAIVIYGSWLMKNYASGPMGGGMTVGAAPAGAVPPVT